MSAAAWLAAQGDFSLHATQPLPLAAATLSATSSYELALAPGRPAHSGYL